MAQEIFNSMELDAIGEIMNISLGSSATAVSNMLDHRVDITTPSIKVVSVKDFSIGNLEPAIGIEIRYVSGLEGSNIMLLKKSDIKVIVDILMGTETPDDEFELNELTVSAVCEVMNQMMGAASTALSDFLGRAVNISTPQSFALEDIEKFKKERFSSCGDTLVVVRFELSIENILKSEFVNVMSVDLARELLAGFEMNFGQVPDQKEEEAKEQPAQQQVAQPAPNDQVQQVQPQEPVSQPAAPQPVVQTVPAQPAEQPQQPTGQIRSAAPKRISATPIDLPELNAERRLGKEQADNLEMIMSVPLEISVEIGRTRRRVEEILSLGKGSLVVLDKLAGDQVDLFVNGLCVAKGDVVVIDDNFGVRITEVLRHGELLKMNETGR